MSANKSSELIRGDSIPFFSRYPVERLINSRIVGIIIFNILRSKIHYLFSSTKNNERNSFHKMLIDKKEIKKILIIKLKGIGDVVLSTIVLENIKSNFPNAQIDFLTEKPSKDFLSLIPLINNVITQAKKSFIDDVKLIAQIRSSNYDLVLDFYSNPRTAIITFLSGAKYRAGFPFRFRKFAYNLLSQANPPIMHAAKLHLEFLKNIGLKIETQNLHFGISEKDHSFAKDFFIKNFDEKDFVIGVIPGGGWQSKRCDPIKFAEIISTIDKTYKAKFFLLWGPSDRIEAEEILKLINNKVLLSPPTNIQQMAALISNCKMIISNDSGPMHISTAVGTPVLSLHGPTSPIQQGPFGEKHEYIRLDELDCIECNLLDCPRKHECFLDLPVENVMKKIASLINKNNLITN
ncbi:MAG: hypothetical protein C0425_10465 [Chlorobiaceae bacterium]|nr:hypothetical protein [Chlorobiaceae bacterium]MBA4310740.1 hypothetical protein [Chlorobiaceae bacterium]